jgi:predicted nucleic acid-binding protein
MKWLLDTNVVSENVRPLPNKSVVTWIAQRPPAETAISIITVAELHVGALSAGNQARRIEIARWIEDEVMNSFAGRVLPLTTDILIDWLQLGQRFAAKGKTRAPADLLIACTARVHDLIVVSRNTRDFANTGIIVYDPWNDRNHRMDVP